MNAAPIESSLYNNRQAHRILRLVREYLVDFDLRGAAARADVNIEEAMDFYRLPMFAQTVAELVDLMEPEAVMTRQQLLNRLKVEAFADGLDSNSSSRIKALTELARLLGMDPPSKSEVSLSAPVVNIHLHASSQLKPAPAADGCISV